MPAQSRSQRKRQAARQQNQTRRPPAPISSPEVESDAPTTPTAPTAPTTGPTVRLATPTPTSTASVASRANRSVRRPSTRPAPEPVDYSKDYTAARRDLRWIALWSVLLFACMFVLKVSGIV
jgi:hypothetical protein